VPLTSEGYSAEEDNEQMKAWASVCPSFQMVGRSIPQFVPESRRQSGIVSPDFALVEN
jgi:hypothetical protein